MTDPAAWLVLAVMCLLAAWIVVFAVRAMRRLLGTKVRPQRSEEIPLVATIEVGFGYKGETGAFHTKIVGVKQRNRDGSKRQRIIRQCKIGEVLQMAREPQNPYDSNAIGFFRANGQQLGYMSGWLAAKVAPWMDAGYQYECTIKNLTGGGLWKSRGVNVWIRHVDGTGPGEERPRRRRRQNSPGAVDGV